MKKSLFQNYRLSQQIITLLHSYEGPDNYIYDIKWSPFHPALFALVYDTIKFSEFNLKGGTEVISIHLLFAFLKLLM